jgi:hypothetical protein
VSQITKEKEREEAPAHKSLWRVASIRVDISVDHIVLVHKPYIVLPIEAQEFHEARRESASTTSASIAPNPKSSAAATAYSQDIIPPLVEPLWRVSAPIPRLVLLDSLRQRLRLPLELLLPLDLCLLDELIDWMLERR